MDLNKLATRASDTTAEATATNGAATVTITAPGANRRVYVTGIGYSANGTPAAAVQVTLADGDGTGRGKFEVSAAAFTPVVINYHRPLAFPVNKSVVFTLPALGSGIRGTAFVHYFTDGE